MANDSQSTAALATAAAISIALAGPAVLTVTGDGPVTVEGPVQADGPIYILREGAEMPDSLPFIDDTVADSEPNATTTTIAVVTSADGDNPPTVEIVPVEVTVADTPPTTEPVIVSEAATEEELDEAEPAIVRPPVTAASGQESDNDSVAGDNLDTADLGTSSTSVPATQSTVVAVPPTTSPASAPASNPASSSTSSTTVASSDGGDSTDGGAAVADSPAETASPNGGYPEIPVPPTVPGS